LGGIAFSATQIAHGLHSAKRWLLGKKTMKKNEKYRGLGPLPEHLKMANGMKAGATSPAKRLQMRLAIRSDAYVDRILKVMGEGWTAERGPDGILLSKSGVRLLDRGDSIYVIANN
jgi:hypothetical protein